VGLAVKNLRAKTRVFAPGGSNALLLATYPTRYLRFRTTLMLLFLLLIVHSSAAGTTIHTTLGDINGQTKDVSVDGGHTVSVSFYLGVPFAATTGGVNRFRLTQKRTPWSSDPLDATAYGPGCPQADHNPDVPTEQSEDCLNLNIWIPKASNSSSPLPIGVYFHGGAFKEGSNRGPFDLYDGSYFAARSDVIVITANYRLGALGFLTSNDAGSVGNYGLEDQRFALKWVQENAKILGGDPNRVTLWGESAGGMSGLIHMLSPASSGLFSRVIMESNPAGYIYRNVKEASDFGKGFVKDAKCGDEKSPNETMACLRNADLQVLLKATSTSNVIDIVQAVLNGAHLLDVFLPFTPTSGTLDFPVSPLGRKTTENITFVNPVPLMIGTNRNEGDTFILAGLKSSLSKIEYNLLIDTIFGIEGKNTKIKERYPAQRDSRQSLGALVTDYWFRCASQRVAGDLQTLLGKDVVSMYWYNHSVSFGPEMWPKYNFPFCVNKVCHGAELPFVFHNSANWTLDAVELKLSDYMVDSWSDFIKHDDASLRARGWFGFNETEKKVMALQPNSMIQSTIGTGLCKFWDGIGYDH